MHRTEGTCFYPGNFNPPTKFHLNTALGLQVEDSINHVVVVLGDSIDGEISQEDKYKIWDIYNKSFFTGRISVDKAKEGSPIDHIVSILEKNPNLHCYIAFDKETAKSRETNKMFSKYPNVQYHIIHSTFDKSSEHMMKYVEEDNTKKFRTLIPENISQDTINRIYDILKASNEPVEDKIEDVKETFVKMFNDGFWKNVVINEAKQVGVLYHFTNYKGMMGIISDNFKLKDHPKRISGDKEYSVKYVSLTRNKNFGETISSVPTFVRITLDGDKMSNRYKIKPHADVAGGYGRTVSDDSEEAVIVPFNEDKLDIKQYIKQIDILNIKSAFDTFNPEESTGDDDFYNPPPSLENFNNLLKLLKEKNIKYNLVDKFN